MSATLLQATMPAKVAPGLVLRLCCGHPREVTVLAADPKRASCPRCGTTGRGVEPVTLEAQVEPAVLHALTERKGWSFCGVSHCDAVYFRGTEVVALEGVKRVPFQKSSRPERLVCFCFEHSVADLSGADASSIRDDIKVECKAGRDRCALENPQGRCCLGNVAQVIRGEHGPPEANVGCCGDNSLSRDTK